MLRVDSKTQDTYIVTYSVGKSTKGQDNFKVRGDQANNTKVCLVWYSLAVPNKSSNNINNLLKEAKHNEVGEDIPKQEETLGNDVIEITDTAHVCRTNERLLIVALMRGK